MHWPGLCNLNGYIVFLAELRLSCAPDIVGICSMFVSSCSKNLFKVEKELVSAEPPFVRRNWESGALVMSLCHLLGDTQHLATRDLPGKYVVSADVYGTDGPFTPQVQGECLWAGEQSLESKKLCRGATG